MNRHTIQGQIENCTKCAAIQGVQCGSSPAVYEGTAKIKAMIIGHSPRTNRGNVAETVLNMSDIDNALYKYIHEGILTPLRLTDQEIYCTNLIKCFTADKPEDVERTNKGYIAEIFENCAKLLEREIELINPEIIISLSQTVLALLSGKYGAGKQQMSETFATIQTLNIADKEIQFIPCVHIRVRYRKRYCPAQTERLIQLSNKIKLNEA